MLSYTSSDENTDGKYKIKGECLHGDEKPVNVANGSRLVEMDSSKLYFFDEENSQWRPFEP